MKKLSLKNATSMLSRKEMKAIIGGYDGGGGSSNCCALQWRNYAPPLTGMYKDVRCSLTQSAAQSHAAGGAGGGNWCCTDCGSATWL